MRMPGNRRYRLCAFGPQSGDGAGQRRYRAPEGAGCALSRGSIRDGGYGFIPVTAAYRNRDFCRSRCARCGSCRAPQDIFYDPQTSGGLLCAVPAAEAEAYSAEPRAVAQSTRIIGYVTEKLDSVIYLRDREVFSWNENKIICTLKVRVS